MAITFNGTSSRLVWSGAIASAFPLSIFAWIKPGSAATSHMVAGSGNNAGGDCELIAFADGAAGVKAFSRAGGGSTNAANPASIQTTWQPVLVCFDSSGQRRVFYAAGAVATDFTSSNAFGSAHNRFVIGCRGITDTLFFAGDIAAVAVWQGGSQMTQGHFDSLAAGADPSTVNAAQLIEYWRLLNATDLTGTGGRTLTATAASTASTDPFGTPDTTAPVLTSATASVTGQTTATVGATTDEANGTMYAVVTTSATQPSVAQIVAGQDHTGSAAVYAGNQVISTTGSKTFSATGLTAAAAYYAHMVHRDAASNDSNRLSTAQFTTLPNAPTAPTIGTTPSITSSGATINWTDNSSNETGFIVQVETPSGAGNWGTVGTPAADATSYGVTGLSPSTEYRPRVAATNTGGASSYSTGTAFTTSAGGGGITLTNLERRVGRGSFRGQH
jgi:hypothetical protein